MSAVRRICKRKRPLFGAIRKRKIVILRNLLDWCLRGREVQSRDTLNFLKEIVSRRFFFFLQSFAATNLQSKIRLVNSKFLVVSLSTPLLLCCFQRLRNSKIRSAMFPSCSVASIRRLSYSFYYFLHGSASETLESGPFTGRSSLEGGLLGALPLYSIRKSTRTRGNNLTTFTFPMLKTC